MSDMTWIIKSATYSSVQSILPPGIENHLVISRDGQWFVMSVVNSTYCSELNGLLLSSFAIIIK